jgi:hypothetical protein
VCARPRQGPLLPPPLRLPHVFSVVSSIEAARRPCGGERRWFFPVARNRDLLWTFNPVVVLDGLIPNFAFSVRRFRWLVGCGAVPFFLRPFVLVVSLIFSASYDVRTSRGKDFQFWDDRGSCLLLGALCSFVAYCLPRLGLVEVRLAVLVLSFAVKP